VDQVQTKQNFANIIYVFKLSVKVFALEKLAKLVEHEQSIALVGFVH
jgi:hypothetical protein